MARHRTTSTLRRRTRSRSNAGVAKHWLLIVGVTALVVFVVGGLQTSPFGPKDANHPEPLTMAQVRVSNAAVPIERRRRGRAAPYHFIGGPAARAQAAECLATAALYEIGDDPDGQQAVIQVILNRVRAPGFPRTICGVVYQGYARATGCQFSFTCDGSFDRRPIHVGWGRARRAARRALAGHVFAGVGRATDYHADWTVPYWRDGMMKVARIGPHLFYVRRRTNP